MSDELEQQIEEFLKLNYVKKVLNGYTSLYCYVENIRSFALMASEIETEPNSAVCFELCKIADIAKKLFSDLIEVTRRRHNYEKLISKVEDKVRNRIYNLDTNIEHSAACAWGALTLAKVQQLPIEFIDELQDICSRLETLVIDQYR